MRLAITCNGPGETAGWLRPLLREIYAQCEDAQVHVFYVPDDFATGREPDVVRSLFPQARVYDPKTYLKVALGARVDGLPEGVEAVLYLGGDLMHAARIHKRFGGALTSYKFSRPRYAQSTVRAFAVDGANVEQLVKWGVPRERVSLVGNLAIDGALIEAQAPVEAGTPEGGILFMPGSRTYEVEHLLPFFFTAALRIRMADPNVPIAFGISPFTELSAVRAAVEGGGDRRFFALRGTLSDDGTQLVSSDGLTRFPIVRNAPAAARRARLAVTIPGTKVIELAAVGTPVVACTPLNAPELAAINGPLTYLDRIPVAGAALKRAVAVNLSRRFVFHTQPNIDAQRSIVHELHGTLTPGRVAHVALERLADAAWLAETSQALQALYREQAGAAARMAAELIRVAQGS